MTNNDMDSFTGRSNTTILVFVYKWAPEGNPTERNVKLCTIISKIAEGLANFSTCFFQ